MKYLVVIGGPTASGKTGVAIALAQHYQTAILSADSRQFYREMHIGTAKPTVEEQAAAPHYFVDFLSIEQSYSVGDFERDALAQLDVLFQQHDLVLLCGGSGLYIKALCEGLDQFPEVPPAIRQELQQVYAEQGIEALQEELQRVDPIYYAQVDLHNPQRLMRALEVCRASQRPYSSFRKQKSAKRSFQPIYLRLDWERSQLYDRINQRVDLMIEQGLEAEAKALYPMRVLNALQTVGYQELFDYFDGTISLEEAIELIKRNSRRYAKRQMTWLRRDTHWKPFAPEQIEAMIAHINEQKIQLKKLNKK